MFLLRQSILIFLNHAHFIYTSKQYACFNKIL